MDKRRCNKSGLELSVLGLGCWAFGGGEYWGPRDQNGVNEVVHAAVDMGINYFDTAEAYNEGRSESSLGKALQNIPRDKVIIGSKVSPSNGYYETLLDHCHASLNRLNTDYIDIYMIHWPLSPHSIKHFTNDKNVIQKPPGTDEAISALKELQHQGKIRHIGISNFGVSRMLELPLKEIAVNELPYNLLSRGIEYEVLPFCSKNGIGVIGYMTLLQGLLGGNYSSLREVPVTRRRTRHFNSNANPECRHNEPGCEQETKEALAQIRNLADKNGYSMAEIAIKWVISNPIITCSLAGARTVVQLEQNVKSVLDQLPVDIVAELNRITDPVKNKLGPHFDYYESVENDRTI